MAYALGPWKADVPPGVARTGRMALFSTGKPNVKALAKRGDEDGLVAAAGYQDLIPAAGDQILDRGAEIRAEAILALGRLGPEAGTEAVHAALSDPADGVRVAAIQVLFARRDAMALANALAWLPGHHGHSWSLAIKALAELRPPGCASAVAAALVRAPGTAPVGENEAALLKLLLDTGNGAEAAEDVIEELLQALGDERDPVADRAEDLLAWLAPLGIDGVIAELEAGAAQHRAATVLAEVKDTRALKPLMDGLLQRDPRVRAECARALGELRDPAAVEALIHASRDPEHRVRAEAGCALDRLGMIALVVGVSTMIRPMILEAVSGADLRPALGEADAAGQPNGNGNHDGGAATIDTISPEELEELLAGSEEPDE
jgi:HEAT repeat protein